MIGDCRIDLPKSLAMMGLIPHHDAEALSKASLDATAAASKLVGGVTGAASGLADNVSDVLSGLGSQVRA